ncbi:MAG: hypothetical protein Tsb0032_04780 [Kiloniellaceae bacterium]
MAAPGSGGTTPKSAPKPGSRRFLTVSNKLAALGALCISVGFVFVIWIQTDRARAQLYEVALHRNTHTTELIADQLYGPVRWRKPAIVQQVYDSVIANSDLGVVAAITLDRHDALLTVYQKNASNPIDISGFLDDENADPANTGHATTTLHNHFVVIAPVMSRDGLDRAGTIALAWDLSSLDKMSHDMMVQAITVTFGLLAAFITLSLLIVHRYLSQPLAQIAAATNRIANGDKGLEVPWTGRKDEIGDMARSLVTFQENVALIDRLTAEQQQQTQRLANALEKEREYNGLHREFVTMVSHEFRTPVAIIDGAAQRIDRRIGKDTPDQLMERTGKIRNAVTRMIELIDSTLSVSRIEAGTIELELGECDFAALLKDICQRQQEISKHHKISVTVADMPQSIVIDAKRMDQVFTNLLSNAVKYAPDDPKIDVKAGIIGENVVVSVRDSGLGIPKEELPKLFEKFFRASTSTGIPGTGIGLHLVKHLIELHQGSIKVDSIEGQGTTFSVTFPIRQSAHEATTTDADSRPAALSA